MDWAFDDLLGDFQISPSSPMSMPQELSNPFVNKEDFLSPNPQESGIFPSQNNNEESSPPTTSTAISSSALPTGIEHDPPPDYVSELHQLLSQEEHEREKNNKSAFERTAQANHHQQQSFGPFIEKNINSLSISIIDNKNSEHDEVLLEDLNIRLESSLLPLLLSPPPAYKDDVSETLFSNSNMSESSSNETTSKATTSDRGIHPVMCVQKLPSGSNVSGALFGGNTTTTSAGGETFLAITSASRASSSFPTADPQTIPQHFHNTLLPFSITRLPGAIQQHSTTIKPSQSSSNSFSLLPITPVTVSSSSTSTSATNSPLLLKALTPQTTCSTILNASVSSKSKCSITPLTSLHSETDTDRGDIKRLKSQTGTSLWPCVDLKSCETKEIHCRQILSAPASVEPSVTTVSTMYPQPLHISLPITPLGSKLKKCRSNLELTTHNKNPLIVLPLTPMPMANNEISHNDDDPMDTTNDDPYGNGKKTNEKDKNLEAANVLAKSLEALQNTAKPQPGESSIDLMNALSLSILPLQDDLNNRQSSSSVCDLIPSSDLSLNSNICMGNQCPQPTPTIYTVPLKCPTKTLSNNIGNGPPSNTVSIKPIWKQNATTVGSGCVNITSKSAWDSAVVAQLGTLKPCTPPPSALRITSQGIAVIHPALLQSLPVELLPPSSIMKPACPSVSSCLTAVPSSIALLSLPTTLLPTCALLNEHGTSSVPSSPQQSLGTPYSLLPPPPYPTSSSSNNSLTSGKTLPSPYPSKMTPMSEADSGVESIDSLSPKDISPISSPSIALNPSESILSNCIIPPPPVSFSSSAKPIPTTDVITNFNCIVNAPLTEEILTKQPDFDGKIVTNKTSIQNQLFVTTNTDNVLKSNTQTSSTSSNFKSVLSALLSTVPKPTKSSELLNTLLNTRPLSTLSSILEARTNKINCPTFSHSVQPAIPTTKTSFSMCSNFPKESSPNRNISSVVAINPNDMTLTKKENNTTSSLLEGGVLDTTIEYVNGGHVSFAEVLNNIDDLGSLEQPILRSTLEDMDTSMCQYDRFYNTLTASSNEARIGVTLSSHHKNVDMTDCSMTSIISNIMPNTIPHPSCSSDSLQTPKHDSFDCMLDQGQKLVPSWDTDLHLRLKQLDSELGKSKTRKQNCSSISQPGYGQDHDTINSKITGSALKLDVGNISSGKLQSSPDENKLSNFIEQRSNSIAPTKTLLCQHCNEEFESNVSRNAHMRKVHSRRHLCVPCDMAFASSTKLERHLLTHKGTKDHKCHICGKAFMIERNLILHQKLHLGQRDYVCDICGKSYYTKSGLLAHQKQNHSPPNENNCGDEAYIKGAGFVCKDKKCNKRNFATRYDLEQHRKQDHQNDLIEETLKCVNCNATFKSSTQLKRHTANAHCSRPYKCPHCPHRSKNKSNLERHVTFHTSNKDAFQCLHCGRKFAFKNSMKKHLEKGRCTVLKEVEKAERKHGKIGPGPDSFKDYLEATIMRHLQQTPKYPALSTTLPLQAQLATPHKTLSSMSIQLQPHVQACNTISFIPRNSGSESITSIDTSCPAPILTPSLNFSASSNPISTSSLISSYNSVSICSDRNLQSVTPMASNENHVPNDIVYHH